MDLATDAKINVEETQRQQARERESRGEQWYPKFFALHNDKYIPKLGILPEEYRPNSAVTYFASLLPN